MQVQIRVNKFVLVAVALVTCSLLSLSSPVVAQETGTKQDSTTARNSTELEVKKEDVRIFLDKIEILGRIEKPQTVFIIPGKDATVNDIEIDRSFFREIFRSVEKDVFKKRQQHSRRQANPQTN